MQMKSDEARKDLRWWASLLLTTLAPENGLNRMNGFNVSCPPPLSSAVCWRSWLYLPNQQTLLGAFVPSLCNALCRIVPLCRPPDTRIVSAAATVVEKQQCADFFASSIHLLPHLARLGGRLPLPSTHCWEHSLKIGLLCLLTNWEISFDGSDLTENVINLFWKPGLAVLHYPFPFEPQQCSYDLFCAGSNKEFINKSAFVMGEDSNHDVK